VGFTKREPIALCGARRYIPSSIEGRNPENWHRSSEKIMLNQKMRR
jgi:hypothetical protein